MPVEEKPYVLKLEADFSQGKDVCSFYYKEKSFWSRWQKIGPEHRLRFGLDHFCGCRFGLAVYSTKEAGGSGVFSGFAYHEDRDRGIYLKTFWISFTAFFPHVRIFP